MTREQAVKKAEELNANRKGGSMNHFQAWASSNPNIWVVCEYGPLGTCVNIIDKE